MTGQQLKNSILQLAVQGKLVPQDPNDEPASVLLERIRKEKEQLIKEGEIKKEKNPSYIFRGTDNLPYEKVGKNEPVCIADEVPFEIPDSWEWARLNTICTKLVDGDHNPPKGVDMKTDYIMASSTNINNNTLVELEKVRYLSADIFEKENERTGAIVGDIFFTSVGSLGRSCVYSGGYNICFQRSVSVLSTMIYNYYLKYCLDSGYIQQKVVREATGTAQKGFYLNQLASLLIPIPPIEEQYRIVAKYEEISPFIMSYASTVEAVASLNTEFPDQIKKSILQEAVQGKLVPQNLSDEPASVLLERIRAEKEQLIKAGKIRRDKHESVIFRRDNSHYEKLNGIERCIDDEIPFDIPPNWCWVHLSDIMNVVSARRVHQSDWKKSGVPFYRAREVSRLCEQGYVDNELYISEELFELFSQNGVPSVNDIMVTAVGTLGKTYVVKETDRFYYKDASVICFENFGKINPFYMQLVMASPYMTTQIKEHSSGTTVGTITISTANNYYVPVPPLAEQQRIVSAYNSLIPRIEQI